MSSVSLVGLLPLISLLAPFIILLLIIFFVVKTIKRFEKRSDEKLALEKETTQLLQSKVNGLDERLLVIEKMLKEVE